MSEAWLERPGAGPREALSPEGLDGACRALRAQAPRLAALPWRRAAAAVGAALAALGDPASPIRQGLERDAAALHGPLATWRWGLEATLAAWDDASLHAWLRRDLGDPDALDGWVAAPGGGLRRARGPALLWHVQAGNLGAPGMEGLVAAALLKAPAVAKLAAEDDGSSLAFARALVEAEPAFAGAVAVGRWPGEGIPFHQAALRHAQVALLHGSDAAVRGLGPLIPPGVRLVAHPHRISVAYVAVDPTPALADALALDAFAYEQLGCLSPRAVFVEGEGPRALAWAEALAEAAARLTEALPPGRLPVAVAAEGMQARGRLAFGGRLLEGPGWAVGVEGGAFTPSPAGRFILVRGAASAAEALGILGPAAARLQGVSLAAPPERFEALADAFTGAGAALIAVPGQLQRPPAGWPADGRPLLADLVGWAWRSPLPSASASSP